jgi:mannitol-1-phosphate/altronate dehydrogenase
MQALNATTLLRLPGHLERPAYDRTRLAPGIVHIGVGNFHRTHMAVYLERCLALGGQEAWGLVGLGLGDGSAAREKAAAFDAQDGLYTVTEYAPDGTTVSRVIGAMIRYVHAPANPDAALAALADPRTRIVSLTITEGGYNIVEATNEFDLSSPAVAADLDRAAPPRTAFRYVVEALSRRRRAGADGVTLLSCDNLRSNGAVTRKAFVGFARAFDPLTAAWMEEHCTFPDSMVDRIAPKVGPEEAQAANRLSGVEDRVPAIAESYIQWVVEDRFASGRPALDRVGVELRDDVKAFETIKGRMLNASHMMMSYPSILLGHRLVHEAMRDGRVLGLLARFLDQTAIPLLAPPVGVSLAGYRDLILARFSNPAVGDQLLRIAHDGLSKLPIFLSATTREVLEQGQDPSTLAFHLACFRRYFDGRDDQGAAFEVHEPLLLAEDRERIQSNDPLAFLGITPFAPLQLASHAGFCESFLASHRALRSVGVEPALAQLPT